MGIQIGIQAQLTSIQSVCRMILHCRKIICRMICTILFVVGSSALIMQECLFSILHMVCKRYSIQVQARDLIGFCRLQMYTSRPWIVALSILRWFVAVVASYRVQVGQIHNWRLQRKSLLLFIHWMQTSILAQTGKRYNFLYSIFPHPL